jgi:hypothetical protein
MSEQDVATTSAAVVLNRDLMFGTRIRRALASQGLRSHFARDTAQFIQLLEATEPAPAIGIIDMNGAVAWDDLRQALARLDGRVPTLGFGSHIDVETRRAAKAAGVTRIVSNNEFHRDMTALISRYRSQ